MVLGLPFHLARMAKYGLVSGLGVTIQTGCFYWLTRSLKVVDVLVLWGFPLPWTLCLSVLAASLSDYALHSLWTFGRR